MSEYIYQADPIGEGQYHYTLVGELVRCGKCKYRQRDRWGWYCDNDTADPYERTRSAEDANWFCADGKRRTDE